MVRLCLYYTPLLFKFNSLSRRFALLRIPCHIPDRLKLRGVGRPIKQKLSTQATECSRRVGYEYFMTEKLSSGSSY